MILMEYPFIEIEISVVILLALFFHFFLTIKDWNKSEKSFRVTNSVIGAILFIFGIFGIVGSFISTEGYFLAIFVLSILIPFFVAVFIGWLIRWIVIKR
ncbi:hypothetical protein JW949_04200 [Candidatus Woesearchaeota archaeon]|nr:hypothetical protein [Candidatus Woesearchaeota archaeon]